MGEFIGNERQGYVIEENLESKCEGTYINDLNGKGILTFNDVMKYIGQIFKAKYIGFGKMYSSDGSYFIGEFKDALKYKGILFYNED